MNTNLNFLETFLHKLGCCDMHICDEEKNPNKAKYCLHCKTYTEDSSKNTILQATCNSYCRGERKTDDDDDFTSLVM